MKKALVLILFCSGFLYSQTEKGSISGRIRNLDGTPAAGVRVSAAPIDQGTAEISSLAQADASGMFRLENLPPGRYRVFAGLVDFPSYFPGVTEVSSAAVVAVTAGTSVTGIDFSLVRPASLKVSGRVTMPPVTTPGLPGRVALMPRSSTALVRMPMDALIRPDGTFEILNVLPGAYSVTASAADAILKEPSLINVEVNDVTGIELVLLSTDTPTAIKGMEQAWSVDGSWGGVAAMEKEGILLATTRARGFQIDSAGKTLREQSFPTSAALRPAKFSSGPALLSFATWSRTVNAYDEAGTALWTYPSSASGPLTGIDDAAAVDLNGDGIDEVAIGFNGGTGIHVVNDKGEVLWKSAAIGNVWHVAGGDLRGNGKPQVITTSARGVIHVFSDDGSTMRDIAPGFYANMVRVGKVPGGDATATIFAAGASNIDGNRLRLAAFSADGTQKWATDLISSGRPSAYSTALSSGKPWIAVGLQSGQIYVVDTTTGAIVASADGQGSNSELTWMTDKASGASLLVVASRAGLRAFRVKQP